MARSKTPQVVGSHVIKDPRKRTAVVLFLIAIGILGIYASYLASFLGVVNQVLLALIVLVATGNLIRAYGGFIGWNAMYLMATTRGITTIDKISQKGKRFWEALALWGLVLGLGILAYPFLKGKIDKKLFIFGLISLYFVFSAVQPYTLTGAQFITVAQVQAFVQGITPTLSISNFIPNGWIDWLAYAITIIAGFSGFIVYALLLNAIKVIVAISAFFLTVAHGVPQTSTLAGQIPGVIPVIPGITIPLVAGLAALVFLLVVHEASHGVLARIAKVRLKSVGLLMIGVLPIGAFVEPDEKQVMKLDSIKQTKIFAAGSSMNFLFSIVFFVIVFIFLTYIIPSLYANQVNISAVVQGLPAANVLKPGMQIIQWNGYHIQNVSSFAVAAANDYAGKVINIVTNTGSYNITAVSVNNSTRGYIGVNVYQPLKTTPAASFAYFLYTVFALSLTFNFFVAVFNLLPIPMFDGWRIYKSNIKNQKLVTYMAYGIGLLILINIIATVLAFLV